jgi:hypothetical protein
MEQTFKNAVDRYVEHLIKTHEETGAFNMNHCISYEDGKKYVKVRNINGAHSYIVKEDHSMKDRAGNSKNFKAGDILAAADNFSPQLTSIRGNLLNNDYGTVTWASIVLKERKTKSIN